MQKYFIMNNPVLDVIIIGAGQNGLGASYWLKQFGLEHIVLERGKIGESWRSQRWDSFVLNTVNRLNLLPGHDYEGNAPDAFSSAAGFAAMLRQYAEKFELPVAEHAQVISIEKEGETFKVTASQHGAVQHYFSRQVIVASGTQNEKIVPSFATAVSSSIKQLHTSEYRNAAALPQGAVLVVGGAQSGCQVTDDLLDAGRKVYLSTSMVGRVPRKYRGKDILDWLLEIKFFDMRKEDVPDPNMLHMKPPQLTGAGDGTKTISFQSLAAKGAVITGRLENAEGKEVSFQPNAAMHVQFADMFSAKIKNTIDEYLQATGQTAPPAEIDAEDTPDTNCECASTITSLNLDEHNIGSIIWATGFSGKFDYIKLPIADDEGNIIHTNGASAVEGLYFMCLPWLVTRKSFIINGVRQDAEVISRKVYEFAKQNVYA
jgi:putative flavoprotein involved in K+ transport